MTTVRLNILSTGYCVQLEAFAIRGGPFRLRPFYATCALIKHPVRGNILIDTGYSKDFFRATRSFPEILYRLVTPVTLNTTAAEQLVQSGIAASDVNSLILTHFHADHICGLRDFRQASYVFHEDAYRAVRNLAPFPALRRGFLRTLLPDDFEARAVAFSNGDMIPLSADFRPFTEGYDIFQDGSLVAVNLPGHADGQIGVFVQASQGLVLLAADVCWYSREYRDNILPPRIVKLLLASEQRYQESLNAVHKFHRHRPDVPILPAHCPEVYREWVLNGADK